MQKLCSIENVSGVKKKKKKNRMEWKKNSRVSRVYEEECSMCLVTVGELLFDEIREFNKKSDFPSFYTLISRILLLSLFVCLLQFLIL